MAKRILKRNFTYQDPPKDIEDAAEILSNTDTILGDANDLMSAVVDRYRRLELDSSEARELKKSVNLLDKAIDSLHNAQLSIDGYGKNDEKSDSWLGDWA